MKCLYLFLSLLLSTTLWAQGTGICNLPCELEWDAPSNMSDIEEYRLYVSRTSGDYNFASPFVTVPLTSTESVVVLGDGLWYAVVTAAGAGTQSQPSNELPFIVPFGPGRIPQNLRIKITEAADGTISVDIERTECPVEEAPAK